MTNTDDTSNAKNPHDTPGVYVDKGKDFNRDMRYITTRITVEGEDGYEVEPNRYRLIAAQACPWANRAIIVRRLLGLEDVISMGLAGPVHDPRSWTFDLDPDGVDPVLGIERLQEAYFKRQADYPRGITVPAMVDERDGAVVTNDFDQITRDFASQWKEFHREGAPNLWPEEHAEEMESVMKRVFTEVNNGVYRCGFAGSQEPYEEAYDRLWTAMDWLEERLTDRRGEATALGHREVARVGPGARHHVTGQLGAGLRQPAEGLYEHVHALLPGQTANVGESDAARVAP